LRFAVTVSLRQAQSFRFFTQLNIQAFPLFNPDILSAFRFQNDSSAHFRHWEKQNSSSFSFGWQRPFRRFMFVWSMQFNTHKTKNMKQFFTLVLLAASFFAKSTPLHNKPAEPAAVQAFEAAYGKNTAATWNCTPSGCQVQFEHKGQYITAVYSHTGKLRFYKKHILSTQLPAALQLTLKNHMNGYWITDVQETSARSGATYVLTLENAAKKITLNAAGGTWQKSRTISKA
jgi:hypothetical protein